MYVSQESSSRLVHPDLKEQSQVVTDNSTNTKSLIIARKNTPPLHHQDNQSKKQICTLPYLKRVFFDAGYKRERRPSSLELGRLMTETLFTTIASMA